VKPFRMATMDLSPETSLRAGGSPGLTSTPVGLSGEQERRERQVKVDKTKTKINFLNKALLKNVVPSLTLLKRAGL